MSNLFYGMNDPGHRARPRKLLKLDAL